MNTKQRKAAAKNYFIADPGASVEKIAKAFNISVHAAYDARRLAEEEISCFEPERRTHCPHGNPLGACIACDVAADFAYDAARESRL